MAETGKIQEYIGRTIDLQAYQGVSSSGDVKLNEVLALPGEGGAIVTGIQKVVGRFIVELLKERGSVTFRPDDGTGFLTEARLGRFQTQAEVLGAFARGVTEARRAIQAQELATDPGDERFVNAIPTNVIVSPGSAIITFELITQAGADRTFIFPLKVPI